MVPRPSRPTGRAPGGGSVTERAPVTAGRAVFALDFFSESPALLRQTGGLADCFSRRPGALGHFVNTGQCGSGQCNPFYKIVTTSWVLSTCLAGTRSFMCVYYVQLHTCGVGLTFPISWMKKQARETTWPGQGHPV